MTKKELLKLIKDNESDFKDADNLSDFIESYGEINADEVDFEYYEDYLHEYADSATPIYYNDIVKTWSENTQCHGEAQAQGLLADAEGDAHKIMQCDLYTMYYNELSGDLYDLKDLAEEED